MQVIQFSDIQQKMFFTVPLIFRNVMFS